MYLGIYPVMHEARRCNFPAAALKVKRGQAIKFFSDFYFFELAITNQASRREKNETHKD